MADIISQLVWDGDLEALRELLLKVKQKDESVDYISNLDEWDCRGNTPLHLAVMLGRLDIIQLFLRDGQTSVSAINAAGWTVMDEAVCLGNRQVLAAMIKKQYQEDLDALIAPDGSWDQLNSKAPEFHLELEIKTKSPVPVMSKLCPKEKISIWKTHNTLRIDWSIAKCVGLKLKRSRMSFLATVSPESGVQASVINRDEKTVENLWPTMSKSAVHDLIDTLLRDGVVIDELPLEDLTWTPKNKNKKVHHFRTELFQVSGLGWKQRTRIPCVDLIMKECVDACRNVPIEEHAKKRTSVLKTTSKDQGLQALQYLSESDLSQELERRLSVDDMRDADSGDDDEITATQAPISAAATQLNDATKVDAELRERLNNVFGHRTRQPTTATTQGGATITNVAKFHLHDFPHPRLAPNMTSNRYFHVSSQDSSGLQLGRECSYSTQSFTKDKPMSVFMCRDFPLNIQDLIPVLIPLCGRAVNAELLKVFLSQVGPGFPVRAEFPFFEWLSLKVTVLNYSNKVNLKPEDFQVPSDYRIDEILPVIEL